MRESRTPGSVRGAVSNHRPYRDLYELPFQHLERVVKPIRLTNNRERRRRIWWRFGDVVPKLSEAISGFGRYIATPRVSKFRLLVWLDSSILPDSALVAIARGDDTTFGILHSRFHEAWSLRLGTSLEDRPRYTPTTTFETFPFPEGLTPNILASAYADDPRAQRIAARAPKDSTAGSHPSSKWRRSTASRPKSSRRRSAASPTIPP